MVAPVLSPAHRLLRPFKEGFLSMTGEAISVPARAGRSSNIAGSCLAPPDRQSRPLTSSARCAHSRPTENAIGAIRKAIRVKLNEWILRLYRLAPWVHSSPADSLRTMEDFDALSCSNSRVNCVRRSYSTSDANRFFRQHSQFAHHAAWPCGAVRSIQ